MNQSSNIVAMAPYPLSAGYRDRLERRLGTVPSYLALPELRQASPIGMLLRLWRLKPDLLILAYEDHASSVLLPIMSLLAVFTRSHRIVIADGVGPLQTVNRRVGFAAGIALLKASADGARSLRLVQNAVARLNGLPRKKVVLRERDEVLYLKTNLMMGVTAGGSVGHIAGVVNALVKCGFPVRIACGEKPVGLHPSVKWHQVPLMSAFGMPFELNYYRYHHLVVRSLKEKLQRPPCLVYQRMSTANYAGVILSRYFCVPYILEYNGSEAWIAKNWGRPLRYHKQAVAAEDACLRHAHVVVTISEVLGEELVARGVERDRIVVYPNGIDPEIFDPGLYSVDDAAKVRVAHGISGDETVIAFIGTFGQWHGTEVLAQAIVDWYRDEPEFLREKRVVFLFVGDGIRMPQVRSILSACPTARVVFVGLVPQAMAPRYLAAADILVSPHAPNADGSRFFGSPTKLFEYMAMAKPIVASDLEQIGEVLAPSLSAAALPNKLACDASELAVLTKPGDPVDLVRGMRYLVEHPESRSILGLNARRKALAQYTWGKHLEAILSGLDRAIR